MNKRFVKEFAWSSIDSGIIKTIEEQINDFISHYDGIIYPFQISVTSTYNSATTIIYAYVVFEVVDCLNGKQKDKKTFCKMMNEKYDK